MYLCYSFGFVVCGVTLKEVHILDFLSVPKITKIGMMVRRHVLTLNQVLFICYSV